MTYVYVEPEVAGVLGNGTVMDRSSYPPVVQKLHYQLEGWLGDVLLESFPAFILTEAVQKILIGNKVTGASFDTVEVTLTDQFRELNIDLVPPKFVWLKPEGEAGRDDIAVAADGRLVVSQRVLDMLSDLGVSHALVEPFE